MRQEAVQQALAAMQSRPKPSLPMPSKRTSVMARSPDRLGPTRNDSGEYILLLLFLFIYVNSSRFWMLDDFITVIW